jgi:hypothetical protein
MVTGLRVIHVIRMKMISKWPTSVRLPGDHNQVIGKESRSEVIIVGEVTEKQVFGKKLWQIY